MCHDLSDGRALRRRSSVEPRSGVRVPIPSAHEVERIIIVPVNELIDEKNQTQKKTILRGIPVTMPYFSLKGEIVWGATSMILSEFKQIII